MRTLVTAGCAVLALGGGATTAHTQTVDPIFANGFEPGLIEFGPAFTAAAEGALGTYPTSSGPLYVTLDDWVAVDTFVTITSSEPSRLVAVGGGVTVPAMANGALVTVDAFLSGAQPVTLRATLGNTMGVGVRVERALNESDEAQEADYCTVQFPATFSVGMGQTTPRIYGRLFEAFLTENIGPPTGWMAQVGYALYGDPRIVIGWHFIDAAYNLQVGNDDEFQASFVAPPFAGTYSYTYRFSADGGGSWTYCDIDGAGSNFGLTFETSNLGVMTVQ